MIYLAIGLIGIGLWLAFEIWRAPLVDQNENILIPEKQLKDLFKRKNK
jgi:hypothetical protein